MTHKYTYFICCIVLNNALLVGAAISPADIEASSAKTFFIKEIPADHQPVLFEISSINNSGGKSGKDSLPRVILADTSVKDKIYLRKRRFLFLAEGIWKQPALLLSPGGGLYFIEDSADGSCLLAGKISNVSVSRDSDGHTQIIVEDRMNVSAKEAASLLAADDGEVHGGYFYQLYGCCEGLSLLTRYRIVS